MAIDDLCGALRAWYKDLPRGWKADAVTYIGKARSLLRVILQNNEEGLQRVVAVCLLRTAL
jgi:hypothetical protein